MEELPTDGHEIIALPVDRLALLLLARLASWGHRDPFSRERLTSTNISALSFHNDGMPVRRAIGEAFDWLYVRGAIALDPAWTGKVCYVTERGRRLLEEPDPVSTAKAIHRIEVDLHPLIARKVRSQFLLGEYENAILAAMREVEIQVREAGGYGKEKYGTPLMRDAFAVPNGPLTDKAAQKSEQEAMGNLFAGAIGLFKNQSSHRSGDITDPIEAVDVVLLADLLLRIVDKRRPNP